MKELKVKRSEMLLNFQLAQNYVKKVGKNKNKLSYACARTIEHPENVEILDKHNKAAQKIQEKHADTLMDFKIDNASLDPENNILQDDKGEFKFTRDALKKVYKKSLDINKLLEKDLDVFLSEEITIYKYMCIDAPEEDLNLLDSLKFFIKQEEESEVKEQIILADNLSSEIPNKEV